VSLSPLEQPFVVGSFQTVVGPIPQVSSRLVWADRVGTYKARWDINRLHYAIEPGLYALGHPGDQSPVLVTANYKMSFDKLRETLPGQSAWILVLDTKGINVWCAAGKGTFGTVELVSRIKSSGLGRVVSHRQLILPQLSGPGVAAHEVKRLSGFKVIYGPIRAADLPRFLDEGLEATPEMRVKTFATRERISLIPVELVQALRAGLIVMAAFFALALLGRTGDAVSRGVFAVVAILAAIAAGAVLTPLLLPWLPGRAFSVKGLIPGFLAAAFLLVFRGSLWGQGKGPLETAAWLLLIPAVSAYLAMNFTGATTFTSLSGVKKEMRWALPFEMGAGLMGAALWLVSTFLA
jgi:acetyl-CoA decarbonylase/synthase complex subunit gamma